MISYFKKAFFILVICPYLSGFSNAIAKQISGVPEPGLFLRGTFRSNHSKLIDYSSIKLVVKFKLQQLTLPVRGLPGDPKAFYINVPFENLKPGHFGAAEVIEDNVLYLMFSTNQNSKYLHIPPIRG